MMQAARFAPACRIFAPLYRQVTLPGVYPVMYGWRYPTDVAYASVEAAWKEYLATSNHGRGIVFIGHSQGTLMLRRLIREQIDPNPTLRARMVGAVLLGGNVMTERGRTHGGDFRNIPICTRRGQAGCVVAYSTNTNVPGNQTHLLDFQFGLDRLVSIVEQQTESWTSTH